MSDAEGPFFRAGADGVLLADFRALADSGRYPLLPVLAWLARVVVGRSGGANRDTPLFELCHLVAAIDSFGGGADSRWLFFLGLDKVLPRRVRSHAERMLSGRGKSSLATVDPDGIRLVYPDGRFEVRYGRAPFLIALYEFLLGMDGFANAQEVTALFDDLARGGPTAAAVGKTSNALARLLRQYRRAHMAWARNDQKFDPLQRFLMERRQGGEMIIDDEAVLAFWLLHSEGSEFRGYKTVFDTFVRYLRAVAQGERTHDAERGVVIGIDVEAGETDPADEAYDLAGFGDWHSPFEIFDRDDVASINFFKAASERKPLEPMMAYGPEALRLMRSFLRLESFAPVQSAITTDLQVKRPRSVVEGRLDCAGAEPYLSLRDGYEALLEHISQMQRATLHALAAGGGTGSDLALDGADATPALAEARRIFTRLTRRGFEPIGDADDPRLDAFRLAAGALVCMASLIRRMIAALDEVEKKAAPGLGPWFDQDRDRFRRQFTRLYGARQ